MTSYIVLRATEPASAGQNGAEGPETKAWVPVGLYEAHSPEAARRAAAEQMDPKVIDAGVWLRAIPQRSWETGAHEVIAETTRRIRA